MVGSSWPSPASSATIRGTWTLEWVRGERNVSEGVLPLLETIDKLMTAVTEFRKRVFELESELDDWKARALKAETDIKEALRILNAEEEEATT